jgi:hypothetical protein
MKASGLGCRERTIRISKRDCAQFPFLSGAEGHVRPQRLGLRSGFDFAVANIVKFFVERFCSGVHVPNPRNRALYNKDSLSRKPIEQNKIPFAMVLVRMRTFFVFLYSLLCAAVRCCALTRVMLKMTNKLVFAVICVS